MMLLWNMLFNKKKNEKTETAAKEEKITEFVVPETTIIEGAIPQHDPSLHDNFNVIESDKDNLMCRLVSDKSKEILRLICTGHKYDIRSTYDLGSSGILSYESSYLKQDDQYHFIVRVFVTKSGRYFYQYIRGNNTTAYTIVSRELLQKVICECESSNGVRYFKKGEGNWRYVPKPGTYTKETYKTGDKAIRSYDESIDSYEIIDQELYDKVIEEL